MQCPNCNRNWPDEFKVCPICAAPLSTTQAVVEGSGAVAQKDSVAASTGAVAVRRDVYGDVIIADPDALWRAIRRRPPTQDLRLATERYLTHLVDRYRYLSFRGMGVSDRIPLRLPLLEMYVPLKARIELPKGETWARELRLAGRKVSAEEAESMGQRLSEPRPVLDLFRQHDGLVILGDPGAGKTTFLKYLALRLALGEGQELSLGARLPVLLPLSAYANALAERDVPLNRFIARYYRDRGVDLPLGPMLDEALAQGGVLLLLDGLDEVKDLARRHLVVQRVLDFVTFQRQKGNKFILSSRIVGYRQVRPTTEGLAECTLVDFEDEDIVLFVEQWTGALERAARGGIKVPVSSLVGRPGGEPVFYSKENPQAKRSYPWGEEPNPNKANYDDTGIGSTSAVGCFPGGASPYGVEDMSGNIWEWCHSLYKDYPYKAQDGREDLEAEDARVLRGGAFDNNERTVRCACRIRLNPSDRLNLIGFRLVVAPCEASP